MVEYREPALVDRLDGWIGHFKHHGSAPLNPAQLQSFIRTLEAARSAISVLATPPSAAPQEDGNE